MKLSDIRMRDPFVVPLVQTKQYWLFGTTDTEWWGKGEGFNCYSSSDLREWKGPFNAFSPPPGFWSDHNFWAPECHIFNDRYYLFATFRSHATGRGTQVLSSDHIEGPYLPHSQRPVTPKEWDCLDGTLFIDEEKNPWIVFCHEWAQVKNGEICALRLSPDLRSSMGAPVVLFTASEAPYVRPYPNPDTWVTDGPFMHRTASGELLMLWSSFGEKGYCLGIAKSKSGKITGPWMQEEKPLFAADGGHGMLFKTFEGKLMLSLHQPNDSPKERPVFFGVEECDKGLRLTGEEMR